MSCGSSPTTTASGCAGRGPAVDALLAHAGRGVGGGDDVEARLAELALEPGGPDREDAADARHVVADVQRARPRGRDDPVGADRRAVRGQPRQVVGVVVHRVVRDVDDVVARRPARRERLRDPRHRLRRAVHDAIEIDEEEHGPMLPSVHGPRLPLPLRRHDAPDRRRDQPPVPDRRSGRAAPPAAVIGKLRAAVPQAVAIDLVFDGVGHGVFGRLAQGMYVRYSGRKSADDVILDLTSEAAMMAGGGPAGADGVLVVTNDRDLRSRVQAKGSRTAPLQWLVERMGIPVLQSPAAGNKRARDRERRRGGRRRAEPGGPRRRRSQALEAGPQGDREGRRRRSVSRATSAIRGCPAEPVGLLGCARASSSSTRCGPASSSRRPRSSSRTGAS